MKYRAIWMTVGIAAVLTYAAPTVVTAEESKFFLQDHGSVRVLRGLDSDKNFEAATLPAEIDVAPAAAPEVSEAEAQPAPAPKVAKRTFARKVALKRARERGIRVIPAGVPSRIPAASGENRRRAIERVRRRGLS